MLTRNKGCLNQASEFIGIHFSRQARTNADRLRTDENTEKPKSACVHFVGFRDERYWSAVKVWGRPDFIHMGWDRRSQREIGSDDIIVFATGDESQPFARNFPDIIEGRLPAFSLNPTAKSSEGFLAVAS